ncbi:sulfotransferase 1A1-like [Haliotis asinina]|uniref:sulfotransferase 1A1-like n=1 Tax=Haliotis asinina TaxID=109174 RepID=UPI003531956A
MASVQRACEERLSSNGQKECSDSCKHTIEIEDRYWHREIALEDEIEKLVIEPGVDTNDNLPMSHKVELKDRSGHSILVNCVDGFYFHRGATPRPFHQHLEDIRDMQLRPDDVFICAYPKSGTHWMWEIVSMVAHEDLVYRNHLERLNQPEFRSIRYLDSLTSPRVMSSHLHLRHLPRQICENRTKIILLRRNPKSVAVSYYHMTKGMKSVEGCEAGLVEVQDYDGQWDDYLQLFLDGEVPWGSWFDCLLDWETERKKHPELQVLDLTFEEMKQNPVSTVLKVASFLGKEMTRQWAMSISEACNFHNLKTRDANAATRCMDLTLKEGYGMYRKGETQEWKKWFSDAQNVRFSKMFATKMETSQYLREWS